MDRDRRRTDIPPEDQYGTGRGQSYRPGGARERTPPPPPSRADTYRARSPPPRRSEYSTESYRAPRPRSRTPPPPRREEYRRPSPSPARYRDHDDRGAPSADTYRGRPRSPPPSRRRDDLPRDDLFRREPARESRDYRDERGYREERSYRDERDYAGDRDRGYAAPVARSPPPRYRDRSPVPLKRGREPSPVEERNRRTPPPAKRERLDSPPRGRYDDYAPTARAESPPRRGYSPEPRERRPSPRRDYRARSRSPPPRTKRVDPRAVEDWRRPRSPSPARYARQDYYATDENGGGRESNATSRRSSPPMHPSRMQQVEDRSGRPTPRDPYDNAREPYRARSPEPRRQASPTPREREYSEDRGYAAAADDRIPPPREPYRADDAPAPATRAPPTGPAGYRAPAAAPPTGPAASAVSISAHTRAPVVPPSGPRAAFSGPPRGDFGAPRGRGGFRGDFGGGRGSFRGGGRGGTTPGFMGRGGGPPTGPGFARSDSLGARERDVEPPTGPSRDRYGEQPPSGPRGSFSQASLPPPQPYRQSSNSTATTYPRSTRFSASGHPIPEPSPSTPTGPRGSSSEPTIHPAIADLPKSIPGGEKAEPLVNRTKLDSLQLEAEKLRKQIEEKEARKRKSLREWERLGRETDAAAVRSQLAEEALRGVSGEVMDGMGGVGF